ncbi:MAG: hypothetical protein A2015_06795 [Spirochaetes bacterium GWF1_31_7]|nr:MAG: hypothetical protein A2Y30_09665 [Spirochaetes bacterium GWE1_32_154]OHD46539.1 MAG: hypothetical protein A2015_06795 [Spirochaetes bacterium GWF1_31_7]OHD49348.1 MAG: hypothetical protein A2Y29_03790 [Spirochaetes bacterium GWE2_31_10]OHD77187.1 MAG: hypothetical protein A2355_02690 [Spirochaetes bacterium RIFOXYB1_FULL_32_8]HBD93087.1 hypothetical protein [Spirochaetia bacterium]
MIKKGNVYKKNVDPSTRAMLIRKGNQFFSEGNIKAAEKIFVSVDYKDGILRLGDYYYDNNTIYKAAEMYFMSGNEQKIRMFSENCARIISSLINEDGTNKTIKEIKTYDKIMMTGNKNGK